MWRPLLAVLLGIHVLFGGAEILQGQQNDSTEYDARALRIESHGGDWTLVRGRDGEVLGKLGVFRREVDLPAVVAHSENAVREARIYKANQKAGSWAAFAGLAGWGIGLGVGRMDGLDRAASNSAYAAALGGLFLMAYGGQRLNKAYTALAKSIWWYNRDLAR